MDKASKIRFAVLVALVFLLTLCIAGISIGPKIFASEKQEEKDITIGNFSQKAEWSIEGYSDSGIVTGNTSEQSDVVLYLAIMDKFEILLDSQGIDSESVRLFMSDQKRTWKTEYTADIKDMSDGQKSFSVNLKELLATGSAINRKLAGKENDENYRAGNETFIIEAVASEKDAKDPLEKKFTGELNSTTFTIKKESFATVYKNGFPNESGQTKALAFGFRADVSDSFGIITEKIPEINLPVKMAVSADDFESVSGIADSLVVNMKYDPLLDDQPVDSSQSDFSAYMVLNMGGWKENFQLPPSKQNGSFSASIPIDLNKIKSIVDDNKKLGLSAKDVSIDIYADIATIAQTKLGKINGQLSPAATLKLQDNKILLGEGVLKANSNQQPITKKVIVATNKSNSGIIKITFIILSAVLALLILMVFFFRIGKRKVLKKPISEGDYKADLKQYGKRIAWASVFPFGKDNKRKVPLTRLKYLVEIAEDTLNKALAFTDDDGKIIYWVEKGDTIYTYTHK